MEMAIKEWLLKYSVCGDCKAPLVINCDCVHKPVFSFEQEKYIMPEKVAFIDINKRSEFEIVTKKCSRKVYDKKNGKLRYERQKSAKGRYTKKDVELLLNLQSSKCYYCKVNIANYYEIDHIKAISKGGSNHPLNLVLSCKSCNQMKHNKDIRSFWYIAKRFYGAELISESIKENLKIKKAKLSHFKNID